MAPTNFKRLFQNDYKLLRLAGIWLDIDESQPPKWFKIYSVIYRYLFLYSLSLILFLNWLLNSISMYNFAQVGYVVLIFLAAVIKTIIIIINRYDDFYQLIKWFDHLECQPRNEEEILITANTVKHFRKIVKLNKMGILIIASGLLVPLLSWKQRQLPIITWYPFDMNSIPIYALVYFHQCIAIIAMGSTNGIVELILMPGCLIFLELQCQLLCERVRKVKEAANEHEICLEQCINDLENIFKFQKLLSKTFGVTYFWQILVSASTMCMGLFVLLMTEQKSLEFIYILGYLCCVSSCLAFPCWLANEMSAMGNKIPMAIYDSDWIDCSTKFKKDLCFFILHAQRPIKLYAATFFEVSLATFVNIFRTSYSYFAIMRNLDTEA